MTLKVKKVQIIAKIPRPNLYTVHFLLLLLWLEYCILLGSTAAAATSLQLCPTLCDPMDGSPPGPLSLRFSRQEHWSGLPFPSPMHESEKWKWSRSVVSDSSRPHGLKPTRLLRPWDFLGKSTGVGCQKYYCFYFFLSFYWSIVAAQFIFNVPVSYLIY